MRHYDPIPLTLNNAVRTRVERATDNEMKKMNESESDYERYHIETERQRLARAEYDDYLLNYDPASDLESTPSVIEQILLGWLKAQIPHDTRMQIHRVLYRIRTWRGHQSDYREMLADRM